MLKINYLSASFRKSAVLAVVILALSTIVQSQGVTCDTTLRGFATLGSGTTGGGAAAPIIVRNIDEMRSACQSNFPAVIIVSGTIVTGPNAINVTSNKSIIGQYGATIQGGLTIRPGESNVIIRLLTIKGAGFGNLPEDAIAGRGATNVWIDHCDLSDAGDGLLDMTKGSDLITVSWNRFSYTNRRDGRIASLIGASPLDANLDRGKLRVTYFSNYFSDNAIEGMARVRFGQAHIANNYYNSPGNAYVIGVGTESQLLVENNMFMNVNNPIAVRDNNTAAFVTETGNTYFESPGERVSGPIQGGTTPFVRPPYVMELLPAAAVERMVRACATVNIPNRPI